MPSSKIGVSHDRVDDFHPILSQGRKRSFDPQLAAQMTILALNRRTVDADAALGAGDPARDDLKRLREGQRTMRGVRRALSRGPENIPENVLRAQERTGSWHVGVETAQCFWPEELKTLPVDDAIKMTIGAHLKDEGEPDTGLESISFGKAEGAAMQAYVAAMVSAKRHELAQKGGLSERRRQFQEKARAAKPSDRTPLAVAAMPGMRGNHSILTRRQQETALRARHALSPGLAAIDRTMARRWRPIRNDIAGMGSARTLGLSVADASRVLPKIDKEVERQLELPTIQPIDHDHPACPHWWDRLEQASASVPSAKAEAPSEEGMNRDEFPSFPAPLPAGSPVV